MTNPIILLGLFTLLVVSCKKDNETNNSNNATPTKNILAGINDGTFSSYDYQPNLEVALVWDAQNLYGAGSDSIDLDMNGSYDLFVVLNVLNNDSTHLLGGALPNPFPVCSMSTSSEFQLAFYTVGYAIGMGQTSSASFIDRLNLSERIDLLTDWRHSGVLWQQNPGSAGTPPFGDWYSATSSNYIGIKQNGNKYGWIEVDASDPYRPKFVRYVISL